MIQNNIFDFVEKLTWFLVKAKDFKIVFSVEINRLNIRQVFDQKS